MRTSQIRFSVPLCLLFVAAVGHAGIIAYKVTTPSVEMSLNAGKSMDTSPLQRYTYYLNGIDLKANEEVNLLFSPNLFSMITNATGPEGYDLILFQPNDPPGTSGYFSAMALTDSPPLTLPFSVDFSMLLSGGTAGSQPFVINQYDVDGRLIDVVDSGFTVPIDAVPEPGAAVPVGLLLVACSLGHVLKHRRLPTV